LGIARRFAFLIKTPRYLRFFNEFLKTFQVLSSGKPIFFFEVEPEYADDEPSERNIEIAENLAGVLALKEHGPKFIPQLISRLPLAVSDREPDHLQPELKAWVSPKIRR
jgi:hypothetical protein